MPRRMIPLSTPSHPWPRLPDFNHLRSLPTNGSGAFDQASETSRDPETVEI